MRSRRFFFFNGTATTEIYTLSLHDALPILFQENDSLDVETKLRLRAQNAFAVSQSDRKSTRLNSSHSQISYAVFCLKKKKTIQTVQKYETGTNRVAAARLSAIANALAVPVT